MTKPTMEKAYPKMTRAQAKLFWHSLTPEQKKDFNKMMAKLQAGELELEHVAVDDNEAIQRVTLREKKPSIPMAPFMGKFNLKDENK